MKVTSTQQFMRPDGALAAVVCLGEGSVLVATQVMKGERFLFYHACRGLSQHDRDVVAKLEARTLKEAGFRPRFPGPINGDTLMRLYLADNQRAFGTPYHHWETRLWPT
jgi:hypothetical protein